MNPTEDLGSTTLVNDSNDSNDSKQIISNISVRDNRHPSADIYILAGDIYFYGLAIVFPLGFAGNLFSIGVFLVSMVLRRTTSGLWLTALGVADSLFLLGEMTRWLGFKRHYVETYYYIPRSWRLDFYHTSDFACKTIPVFRYASNFCSSWFTVAVAVERLVAVARPLDAGRVLTRRRTATGILVIVLVGLGVSLFPLWTAGRDSDGELSLCKRLPGSSYDLLVVIFVYFFSLLLPSVVLILLTSAIIFHLYKARTARRCHLGTPQSQNLSWTLSLETQMTLTLVSICVTTICLRAPYTVAYSIRNYIWVLQLNKEPIDQRWEANTYFFLYASEVISTSNFGVNLLLYCLCGSSFRKEAKKLLCLWRHDDLSSSSTRRATDSEELILHEIRSSSQRRTLGEQSI